MIKTRLFDPITQNTTSGGPELIEIWKDSESSVLWLDFNAAESGIEKTLLLEMGIHKLAVEDAQRKRHPPKIEEFSDYVFLLFRGLDASTNGMEFATIQLAVFVGERFLITRHNKPSSSVDWLSGQVDERPELMSKGSGAMATILGNRLVRRYVEILLELEPRLDELEDEMREKPDDELLAELTRYKSRLRHMARIANYHKAMADQLKQSPPVFIGENLTHEIVDLYEQIERTESLASLYYNITNDLTDGYLALSSHRLNRVMQFLTVITVIFVPLTFLAGIYGMNFDYMPELAYRRSYFILLGVMFIMAVTQLILFRKKGWF